MHDLSRNHINVLSCAAIVALPGEAGTASEIALAIRYDKPVIAYSPNPALVEHFPQSVRRTATIEEVKDFLRLQLATSP
jgi:predicted Rossmann-fold nucleotide-binding protein